MDRAPIELRRDDLPPRSPPRRGGFSFSELILYVLVRQVLDLDPRVTLTAIVGALAVLCECCVTAGDSGCEAYIAIAWGVGLARKD
jgi:hypothetical protein